MGIAFHNRNRTANVVPSTGTGINPYETYGVSQYDYRTVSTRSENLNTPNGKSNTWILTRMTEAGAPSPAGAAPTLAEGIATVKSDSEAEKVSAANLRVGTQGVW